MEVKDFLEMKQVINAQKEVDKIKDKLHISDVKDIHGHQYVNLVQEGGGVLGVALLGFTYILEYAGIRFWRLAGTSAGAINAMFLAAIGQKYEAKSKKILEALAAKKFIEFADGASVVPNVLARNDDYIKNIIMATLGLFCILFVSLILLAYHYNAVFATFTLYLFLFLIALILVFIYFWWRFKKRAWGICKGENFEAWVKKILNDNGVYTLSDLNSRANVSCDTIQLQYDRHEGEIDAADLTLIACDITQGMKVEFPKDAKLYNINDDYDPSKFVRASMSIPVFFEKFCIKIDDIKDQKTLEEWDNIGYPKPFLEQENFFVDGGIVSNFPINIFHNPKAKTARLPVVGIILDDKDDAPTTIQNIGFVNYILRIFNTIRFHSDKDFLRKHQFYIKHCVRKINVEGHNWLNFAMTDEETKILFAKGVDEGLKFLQTFNWENYKIERAKIV